MQNSFFNQSPKDHLTLKEACLWASNYLQRDITTSNISYLINYW